MSNIVKKKLILFDIDHVLFDTEKFRNSQFTDYSVFDDTLNVLKELSEYAELGIFSQGELNFQKAKLKNTKLEQFFERKNVHIFEDKISNLEEIMTLYRGYEVFFVDDKLNMLFSAKKTAPSIVAVWLKRGPHAEKLQKIEGFNPDKTIRNLQNLKKLMV